VHRNTVDYRLRRIAALTGVSPTSVRGIQILATALTRHRLDRAGGDPRTTPVVRRAGR
jgi:DNA-binding PucR family transcriptional regulator